MDTRKAVDRTAGAARTAARKAGGVGQGAASFVVGKRKALVNRERPKPGMDDITLENNVQSAIFRDADAPKDSVSVSVVDGVVELRGEVKRPEIKQQLEKDARRLLSSEPSQHDSWLGARAPPGNPIPRGPDWTVT